MAGEGVAAKRYQYIHHTPVSGVNVDPLDLSKISLSEITRLVAITGLNINFSKFGDAAKYYHTVSEYSASKSRSKPRAAKAPSPSRLQDDIVGISGRIDSDDESESHRSRDRKSADVDHPTDDVQPARLDGAPPAAEAAPAAGDAPRAGEQSGGHKSIPIKADKICALFVEFIVRRLIREIITLYATVKFSGPGVIATLDTHFSTALRDQKKRFLMELVCMYSLFATAKGIRTEDYSLGATIRDMMRPILSKVGGVPDSDIDHIAQAVTDFITRLVRMTTVHLFQTDKATMTAQNLLVALIEFDRMWDAQVLPGKHGTNLTEYIDDMYAAEKSNRSKGVGSKHREMSQAELAYKAKADAIAKQLKNLRDEEKVRKEAEKKLKADEKNSKKGAGKSGVAPPALSGPPARDHRESGHRSERQADARSSQYDDRIPDSRDAGHSNGSRRPDDSRDSRLERGDSSKFGRADPSLRSERGEHSLSRPGSRRSGSPY